MEYTAAEIAKMFNAPLPEVKECIMEHTKGVLDGNASDLFMSAIEKDLNSSGYIKGLTNEERLKIGEKILQYDEESQYNITKHIFLDTETIKLLGGHCYKHIVEGAVKEWLACPDLDIKEKRKLLPLSHSVRPVSLTMDKKIYDAIDKLCAGRKIMTPIIELSIWRKYGNSSWLT